MRYLLDADWVINALAGKRDADTAIDNLSDAGIAITITTIGEIYEGAFGSPDPDTFGVATHVPLPFPCSPARRRRYRAFRPDPLRATGAGSAHLRLRYPCGSHGAAIRTRTSYFQHPPLFAHRRPRSSPENIDLRAHEAPVRASPSVDPRLPALPVGLAKLRFENFPCSALGESLAELDRLGNLETRQ